jgi:hypothetical protein
MTSRFPEPPVDRERIEEVRRYLRRKAADVGPTADPIAREIPGSAADVAG